MDLVFRDIHVLLAVVVAVACRLTRHVAHAYGEWALPSRSQFNPPTGREIARWSPFG